MIAFQSTRKLKRDFDTNVFSHFGAWNEEDLENIIEQMENTYRSTKESLIRWYYENRSIDYITAQY